MIHLTLQIFTDISSLNDHPSISQCCNQLRSIYCDPINYALAGHVYYLLGDYNPALGQ